MCISELIREERAKYNISQVELARKLNISQSIISDIEKRKRPIPTDIVSRLPEALNDSARIKAEISFETGVEFFKVPCLCNVDDNPKNVIDVLVEEAAELIKSAQEIKKILKNIKPGQELEDEVLADPMPHEEQIADVYVALKMHFISMNQAYGIKIKDIETRVNKKLVLKNYV